MRRVLAHAALWLLVACGEDPLPDLTATSAPLETPEDTEVTFQVQANLPATFAVKTAPSHGTLEFGVDGAFAYRPADNFNGPDQVVVTATDARSLIEVPIDITVTPVNDQPIAGSDSLATNADSPLVVDVGTLLANDSDVELSDLTITEVTGGVSGTATMSGSQVTFTPTVSFAGSATFTYTLSDGELTSPGTVTVVVGADQAPVAVNDSLSTVEDTAGTVDVAANDSDGDGDTLTIQSNTQPTNGTVAFTGTVATYTPAPNFRGTDSFTYTVTDGNGGTATATVNVTVTNANDGPIAVDDNATVTEDSAKVINVLGNDTDVDGEPLAITTTTLPAHGTVTVSNNTLTYTPALNFNGADAFDYEVSDGNGGSDTGHVTISVTAVNDAPIAGADTLSTNANTPASGNVALNDSDVDGDALTIQSFTQSANGTVTFAGTTATFTPAANFSGNTTFTYTVSDGKGGTATATVTVFVGLDNDAPVAVNDTLTVNEDSTGTRNVATNDTDADGDVLSIQSFTQPANGTVTFNGTTATYTPPANFNGTTSFTYTIRDPAGATSTATVNVTVNAVNDPPVANDDSLTTTEDTPVTADVRTNDTDVDSNPTITTVTQPAVGGTVTRTATSVTFTPAPNFNGTTTFTYTLSDGTATDTATVTVTVNVVNDGPIAVDDTRAIPEDTATAISGLTGNDTDADGDTLTVTAVTGATGGSVALAGGVITFTPTANLNGSNVAGFDYTVSDGKGGTDTGHVTISINAANDPPVAVDDTRTITEDTATAISGLTGNDTDVEGNTLTLTAVSGASGGSVVLAGGVITFTPTANLNGSNVAGFDYTVSDGNGGTDTGHVTISISAVNDLPIAVDDARTITEDTATAISGLTGNDTDADGDTLTVTAVTGATGGSVALAGGVITFTPTANLNGSNVAGFNYTVSDGKGGTDTGHVTISINAANDPPVAVDDTRTITEDTATAISGLTGNDTDVEGNTLTLTAVSGASGGSVVLAGGVITFTPTANLNGSNVAGFDYTVSDGNGGTDTGHVTISISAVNDLPIAVDDARTITEDTATAISGLTGNDTDADGDTLTVTAVIGATGGSVALAGGVITFTPTANLNGSNAAGFDYTVSDGKGGTDTGHVTISITAVNDPPVAVDDVRTITEDTATAISGLVGNDTDADGDTLAVAAVSGASGGSVVLAGGAITFTPTANLNGPNTAGFDYTVSDGKGGTDTGHVTISITAVNDPPVASTDTFTVAEDAVATIISVLANDSDVEGAVTVTAVTQPAAATGSVTLTGGVVRYTPPANFSGSVSFTYTITDGGGLTATATVNGTVAPVNDPPIVSNVSVGPFAPGGIVTITVTGTDQENQNLTFSVVTAPTHGTLGAFASAGPNSAVVTYTVGTGATADSFTFRATDGGGANSNVGTVSITIAGCGDGVVKTGTEQCDDGNLTSNDGCEANCKFTCGVTAANPNFLPKGVAVDQASGNCFAAYNNPGNFGAAFEICDGLGGHLATVLGSGEQAAVTKVVGFLPNDIGWIGAADGNDEGSFEWVTDEPFGFSAFVSPEPDGGSGENCVGTSTTSWFDEVCEVQIGFICEFNDTTVPSNTNLTGTVFEPSPGGPIPLAGVTLYIVQDTGTWTTVTDSNGRYAVSISGAFVLQAAKANYEQPCVAAGTAVSGTAITKNIELYSDATLSAGGASAPVGSSPVYSGTVYANGSPVANAGVWVVDWLDQPLAYTITDSQGGYFLCRVPSNYDLLARGTVDGGDYFSDYYPVGVASDQIVDLELFLP